MSPPQPPFASIKIIFAVCVYSMCRMWQKQLHLNSTRLYKRLFQFQLFLYCFLPPWRQSTLNSLRDFTIRNWKEKLDVWQAYNFTWSQSCIC